MKHQNQHRNILQWRAMRAKYEAKIRQGSLFALSCQSKLHAKPTDESIADIESVVQFRLKEWERLNHEPQ